MLKVLGELREEGRLIPRDSSTDCVELATDDPSRAALLHIPSFYLSEMSLLSNAQIGRPNASSIFSTFSLTPWAPFENAFNRMLRRVLESNLEIVDLVLY